MPRSRTRHKHHHHHHQGSHAHSQQQTVTPKRKSKRKSAIPIMMAFIALLGLVIAFISAGTDIIWLSAGIVGGAIVGYFIGKGMDRVTAKVNR